MLLDGKVALVTGASRGIGRAIAIRLASEGAKVAINFAGNQKAAEEVKSEIEKNGGEAILVKANVADSAAVEEKIAKVVDAFGTVDILVNYAGIPRSKSAAKELAARGVTVNMVAPGFIDTDMTAVLSDKVKETMVQEIPMRKMGRPEDVAGAVLFLVSDCSSYITGQVVNVDGGMVM